MAGLAKLVPLMVTFRVAPWPRKLGLREVIVGEASTVKPFGALTLLPSGLVMVTVVGPGAAVGRTLTFTVSWLALTSVGGPVRTTFGLANVTATPASKL